MEGFELPMSFGKKAKPKQVSKNLENVAKTERAPQVQPVQEEVVKQVIESLPVVQEPKTTRKRPLSEVDQEPSNGTVSNGVKLNAKGIVDDEDDDLSDEENEEPEANDPYPVSHEVVLKDHSKVVSALAIDSSGARVATASHDYDVKIWDFGGMDARMKPFKTFEPAGNYHIHDVAFSPDNQSLLVISGFTQAKMYTRDGEDGVVFNKGDPYIHDMRHTKGHVADITAGSWHPRQSDEFITSSNDSTIRIWKVDDRTKQKNVIVVKSKERGARTKVTACAYSFDAKFIAGACEDGTLHIWSLATNMSRPSQSCEKAHEKYTATSGIAFSKDGKHLVTRGGDGTVKLWDTRSLRKPLFTAENLPNLYPETNIIFSPDDKSILTGTSKLKDGAAPGEIVILDREGLNITRRLPIAEGSVVKVAWHSKINQIFATTSVGACHVLYSPSASIHGALLPLAKAARTVPKDDIYVSRSAPVIITPGVMSKDDDHHQSKRRKEKARNDPVKSRKPQEPLQGAGKGGRVGASATQHVVQSMFRNVTRDEDPREALLKYADNGESDPIWTSAWTKNQPKPIFSEPLPGDDDKDKKK